MHEPTAYEELNPFIAIWTRPRETVRYVIEEKRGSFIVLLLVFVGFSGGLSGASGGEELYPAWGVVAGALLLGPISAAIGIAIASVIYKLLGKLFGGVGTYTEMFRAVLTASIPQIWLLPLWLIWLYFSPETFYTMEGGNVSGKSDGFLGVLALIAVIAVGIWTFIIQCKAVGEAQRISAWKGFFIIVIPAVLIVLAIIAIVALVLFLAF